MFNATAARLQKWSGDDSTHMRNKAYEAVLPVARAAAENEKEIAELKKQVAELQRQLKPPANSTPGVG